MEQAFTNSDPNFDARIIQLVDFIDQTSRFMTDVQLQSGMYGKPVLPFLENEIQLGIITANELLIGLGGIRHYIADQAGDNHACNFIAWNGFDTAAATHHWTITRPDMPGAGVAGTGADILDELRAKHSPYIDNSDGYY